MIAEPHTYGRSPGHTIRLGIHSSPAPIAGVAIADGCDDPRELDDTARQVERAVMMAAATRYAPGGPQVGGGRPGVDRKGGRGPADARVPNPLRLVGGDPFT
jgi:hypothetical protein